MNEIALIGKKIGMTREFYKTGQLVPVTVLKMEKARVIQVIEEDKRGYKIFYNRYSNSRSHWTIIFNNLFSFINLNTLIKLTNKYLVNYYF